MEIGNLEILKSEIPDIFSVIFFVNLYHVSRNLVEIWLEFGQISNVVEGFCE